MKRSKVSAPAGIYGLGHPVAGHHMQKTDAWIQELYRHYRKLVLRKVVSLTGDDDLAEDIAQDIFASLLQSPPREDDLWQLRAYFSVAARNRVIDHRRRVRRHSSLLETTRSASTARSRWGSPELTELRTLVGRGLRAMPPAVRRAFVRRVLHGQTTAEVASALGKGPQTVRNQVAHGRTILRRILSAAEFPRAWNG